MEMNQASFFSRLFGRAKKNQSVVDEFIDENTLSTVSKSISKTVMAYTPEQDTKYTANDKEIFQQKLNLLPPLRIGEINFAPFEMGTVYNGYFVKVFIRNGKDLQEEISLQQLRLSLIDAKGDKVAGGFFRIPDFGTLKFGEARVWTFAWRSEQVVKREPDLSSFTVAFE